MKFYTVIIRFLVVCAAFAPAANACSQGKPNIILIVADDLGERDLAVYGSNFIETPNLDQLAEDGTMFMQGYASAPICSPTRASIITGSAPARIGMTEHLRSTPPVLPTQEVIPPANVRTIPDSFPILGIELHNLGYHCAHIGKAHFGGNPSQYGYDLVFGGGALPNTYYYPFFNGDPFPELTAYAQPGDFLTDVLTDCSLDFIDDHYEEGPFFLHLNYYAPHVPIEGRQDLVQKYEEKAATDPDHIFPEPEYAAMVEGIDENVGRIINRLRDLEIWDHTLIIFTSDNGALHVEEVPQFAQFTPPTDNYPLRAGKGYIYEAGTRVPFIFAGMTVGAGRKVHTPVISSDLFNTIGALSGFEARSFDGVDIFPLTQGGQIPGRFLFQHFPHYSPQRGDPMSGVRAGKYKLLKWAERNRIELFDLESDLSESCNLVFEEPVMADSLETILENWLDSVGARRATPNPGYDNSPMKASEPFEYRIDSKLESRNNGSGWVYNWMKTQGSSLYIREGTLPNSPVTSSGGFLELMSGQGNVTYTRTLRNHVNSVESIWCSFLLRHDENGTFRLSWSDTGKVSTFDLEVSNNTFLLRDRQTGTTQSFESQLAETHWIVIKFGAVNSPDSMIVWVDPPVDQLPSAATSKASLSGIDLSSGLGQIELSISNSFTGALDELLLGDGFEDLSPEYTPDFPLYNLHEPFTYPLNESLIGQGHDTLGWDGPWEDAGIPGANSISIEAGNLRPDDVSGNTPAHVRLSYLDANTRIRLDRRLESPIISDGSTYWISYWVQTQVTSAVNNVANINLVNSAISSSGGHRLTIGRLYGTGRLGLITPSNGQSSNSNITDQGLRHMVIRIRTASSAPDTVHLWIDPDRSIEPRPENANASLTTGVLKDGIDKVRLRVEGAASNQTPITVSFDHLRIGRTWEIMQWMDDETTTNTTAPNPNDLSNAIAIFPNPADHVIQIRSRIPGNFHVDLYALTGKLVHTTTVQATGSSLHTVPVSHLDPGLYVVHIRELEKGLQTSRFVTVQ